MNTLRFGNRKMDLETIIVIVIMALSVSFGIITLIGGMTGVAILETGILTVLGLIVGLGGIIFGIMVFMYLIER